MEAGDTRVLERRKRFFQFVLGRLHLHLVLLLPLYSSVLEPDLDLLLRQAEGLSDLFLPPIEVSAEVELLLQLQDLVASVDVPVPFPL